MTTAMNDNMNDNMNDKKIGTNGGAAITTVTSSETPKVQIQKVRKVQKVHRAGALGAYMKVTIGPTLVDDTVTELYSFCTSTPTRPWHQVSDPSSQSIAVGGVTGTKAGELAGAGDVSGDVSDDGDVTVANWLNTPPRRRRSI